MSNFHETRMGHDFFLRDVPRIIRGLENIGQQLEKQNQKDNELHCLLVPFSTFHKYLLECAGDKPVDFHLGLIHGDFVDAETGEILSVATVQDVADAVLKKCQPSLTACSVQNVFYENENIYFLYLNK